MASPNVPPFRAEKVEKTSGLPFPKARKVTPAVLSLNPNCVATVDRLGQKKSDAEMPMKENRKVKTRSKKTMKNGLSAAGVESYHSS